MPKYIGRYFKALLKKKMRNQKNALEAVRIYLPIPTSLYFADREI